ncbi:MAG TPA: glycerol kinase GlpK [Candidatus Limnocylindrales bacterium]|nr:glycerol kinase GlpK [Candidatus Limnocylindrales bacterium]
MEPRSLVAAIDQGTTSSRCILFDRAGAAVAGHQLEHRQHNVRPGWVEHDPEEILERVRTCVRVALREAGADATALAAVGITNQRETTVVWSRGTGRPVAPAIVWQDTRTAEAGMRLAADDSAGADRFRDLTGLPISTYSSALKLASILAEGGRSRRAAAEAGELAFGTIDSWLIWQLTGGVDGGLHVTDVTNASRTMLMGLASLAWEPELLDAMGIPAAVLPTIRSSSEVYGHGVGDLAGVPIAGDLGDQQAALFGQTCFEPGQVKCTYGTGCFMLMHTGDRPVPSRHGLITTVAARIGDEPATYALEGSVAVAGALVGWLRDNLGIIGHASEVEALARSVPDSGDVVFVPAFSGLFAPHWRSDARGVIAGLTGHATRGHIARAALEATGYQVNDLAVAMMADLGADLPTELRVDGGMIGNELLMQFQADILGRPVVAPRLAETTALGAAYAAGLAVGFWRDLDDLRAMDRTGRRWEPRLDEETRTAGIARWHKGVERTLGWVDHGA